MSTELLERRFAVMGARVKVPKGPWVGSPRIDVRTDGRGEYFDIDFDGRSGRVELDVVDVQPRDRHLLLLARIGDEKSKFLLGHDERHWFVAAVPESERGVKNVATAKKALQPELVQTAVTRTRPKDPFRRRNDAYVRQGEWFFVAATDIAPSADVVLRNEPLWRGAGTPHVIEYAFRRGGERVYVNWRNGSRLSEV